MSDTPAASSLTLNSESELRSLQQQIAQARAALADLKQQIASAQRQIDFVDSAYLVEVNEQLIVSAMQNQRDADQASLALGELSKSYRLDLLTQVPNRVQLQERFSYAIASALRHGTHMAILFIDIDGFKGINDTLGHAVGDALLQHTARCIASSVRDVDFVCRYGGDEFLVLVTDLAQATDAALVSQKIAAAVASPITAENRTMSVSLSIGMSIYPEDGVEADALIHCADAAMYEAKRLKGGRAGPVRP
ncbi:MAG: diguanylate cyclase domain-containing protein [Giesbergeria sp.]